MSIKDLLNAIHNSEATKLCKISPKHRASEREQIEQHIQQFLNAGNHIKTMPCTFSNFNKKAA